MQDIGSSDEPDEFVSGQSFHHLAGRVTAGAWNSSTGSNFVVTSSASKPSLPADANVVSPGATVCNKPRR
eukprot:scaffold253388_cov40-Prasinocladus_malaysianus.AAC.1